MPVSRCFEMGAQLSFCFRERQHHSSIFCIAKLLVGSVNSLTLWKKQMPEQYVFIVAGEEPFSKQADMKY